MMFVCVLLLLLLLLFDDDNVAVGATVVWMHRHPSQWMAAMCASLENTFLRVMVPSSVDRKVIGQAVVQHVKTVIDQAIHSLHVLGTSVTVIHVMHANCLTIQSTMKSIEKITAKLELPRSSEFEQSLFDCIFDIFSRRADNKASLTGLKPSSPLPLTGEEEPATTDPQLIDYGLAEETVREVFLFYEEFYSRHASSDE